VTLYVYPMDEWGCGHYRVLHPIASMPEDTRAKVKVIPPGDHGGIQSHMVKRQVVDVTVPDDCTAVLVQRPTSEMLANTLVHIHRKGIPVILEIDDDLEALIPQHPTAQMLRFMRDHDATFPRLVAGFASRVVCSTEALAQTFERYVQPGTPVVVARNRIPKALIQPEWERDDEPVLGWPGAVNTHPGDLDVLGGAIARLGRGFRIVGDKDDAHLPALGTPDVTYTGKVDFADWVPTLRDELDVAVVPLKDHRFNRAKSSLKALELAAAGVPMVRPALPEFDQLGIGMAAEKSKHWFSLTRALLEDRALWNDHQTMNREAALRNTYEEHYSDFVEAWGL
jgi:glycosyltransferase involved in cell wall biosynthesis